MNNILAKLVLTIFSVSLISAIALAAPGDTLRLDLPFGETGFGSSERDTVSSERLSNKVDFIAGTAEISDADYRDLYNYLATTTANGMASKVTIAVWPDMVGDNALDADQQDLINSRISEITAILADQGYTGNIETINMATANVDPNLNPELQSPAPSSAVILIDSNVDPSMLSH